VTTFFVLRCIFCGSGEEREVKKQLRKKRALDEIGGKNY